MDYTILYAILILLVIVGLTFLAITLKKKNIVSAEDLEFAVSMLGLSVAIIDELNLKDEDKIKDISQIVIDAVNYVTENMKDSTADKVQLAYSYALVLCFDMNISLTEERKNIIKRLIELSFSKIN